MDLAKRAFQVQAVDAKGEIVAARKVTRNQLVPISPRCRYAWWRWRRAPRRIIGALTELGHEVRLLPPAHVKPYVRRNKSDEVDAAAIYEAMSRPRGIIVTRD